MQSHQFLTNQALAIQLAKTVGGDLEDALNERGFATLAVSGGSTPKAFFGELSRCSLDWSRVTVTQVDERWIEEDCEDSNAHLIRKYLLQRAAARAHFVSMKTTAESPYVAEAEVSKILASFARSIDVVVLGMGEDGHTASFFPGASTLSKALNPSGDDLCVAITPPHAPYERMTLALPALLRARKIYLHIIGKKKWAVLQTALLPGKEQELPIRSVLRRGASRLQIYYASEN